MSGEDPMKTLRLIWPQWQGATPEVVSALYSGVPLEEAERGYALGAQTLAAVLPPHQGPTATVQSDLSDTGLDLRDGVWAKDAVLAGLQAALAEILAHDPERIVTLGGECSVSVAPFSVLAQRYGEDFAVVWIDSHPDVGTSASEYAGYHAMALGTLTGHGFPEANSLLPARLDPSRVAIAGLHAWTEDDVSNAAEWGISTFSPDDLRKSSESLLDWLSATGCSRVAIHLDVDVVDSREEVFGLGAEPGGLTTSQVRRLVSDIAAAADVVGLTVAEYVPRQVLAMRGFVRGFPLLG